MKGSGKMRYAIFISILTAVSCGISSAQTYGLDNTDPAVFSKFKIPNTDLHALWFNTSLYGYTSKTSNLFDTGPNYNSYNRYLNFGFSPQYYMLKESDDIYFSFNTIFSGEYSYSDGKSEGPGVLLNNFRKSVNENVEVNVKETLRNYLNGGDLFFSLNSSGGFSTLDEYDDNPMSDSTRASSYRGQKLQEYSLSIGFGWGKMRNVTAVVSAIRFQERMKRLNLINSNLSDKTIEDLAQQFYREGYYSQVHVRPDKFFWQDVGNALAGDGINLDALNMYAASYLRQVPNELRFMRNEGLIGGIGVGIDYSNQYYSAQIHPPNGISIEQFLAIGNAYVNYSHQLDLNSQVRFDIAANGGPNLTRHQTLGQQYALNADLGYDYELTDMIVVSAENSFDVLFQNGNGQGRLLTDDTNVQLNYFVEDNISLSGQYSLNYSDMKPVGVLTNRTREIDNRVSIGMIYYIDRGMILH